MGTQILLPHAGSEQIGTQTRVCISTICIVVMTLNNRFAGITKAEPPILQTPAPVIFLADNLDEPDHLGFCIDTVGRGKSDRIHVHSCMQFVFYGDIVPAKTQ